MIPEDSSSEVATLKNQVFTLLIALIIVSGTLTVFLYRQVSLAGKDIAAGEQLSTMLTKNETQSEQVVGTFVSRLVEYGQKHPDFVPVLRKYGIAPVPGVPANAQVAPRK